VARGYEKALAQLGHTVKGFYYHDYLQFYDGAYEYWDMHNPDYVRKIDDHVRAASERVVIEAIEFVPEVVLIIAGGALHKRAHDLLYRLDIPMALLLTESPYIDNTQSVIVQMGHISATFTNDKNSVAFLETETCRPTYYLPHSYDPDVHFPGDMEEGLISDVFFHGTLWPEREELLKDVRDLPFDIHISGYTLTDDLETQRNNLIDNNVLAMYYRSTHIALNHHRTYTSDETKFNAYSLGPRAFEIAACGTFQLCDRGRPELYDIFGDSVPTYEDGGELLGMIAYYMRHGKERGYLARAAYERVQGCTFENRAQEILIPVLQGVI